MSAWPDILVVNSTEELEIKKVHIALTDKTDDFKQRFSKLNRLLWVTAYCQRFFYNCRQQSTNRRTTQLTTQEVHQAILCCVKLVQQAAYSKELSELSEQHEVSKTSNIKSLHPFTDKEGILRVGGRLQQSDLPYQTMHQIILPHHQHLTKLIVVHEHIRLHHAGPQLLIAFEKQLLDSKN